MTRVTGKEIGLEGKTLLVCAFNLVRQNDAALEAFERFAVSGILRGSTLRNPLLTDELGENPRFQGLLRKAGSSKTNWTDTG